VYYTLYMCFQNISFGDMQSFLIVNSKKVNSALKFFRLLLMALISRFLVTERFLLQPLIYGTVFH